MSKYKDIVKNGWHPEKAGTTLKGQVKGLVGRGKSDDTSSNHVARPLSSLRDPSSFEAPPKRRGTGLIPAPPPAPPEKRKVIMAPSKYQDPRAPAPPPPPANEPDQEEPEDQGDRPPQPYRVNTTGLDTAHLPKPPGRRDGADGRSPPPPPYQAVAGGPPSLPPRLPPRTNSAGSAVAPPAAVSPAPTGNSGYLNQGALNRLGAAGVSVPGLGIGRSSPAHDTAQSPPQPPRPSAAPPSHMNELQNRFSKLNASPSSSPSSTPPPSQGTTWAQKQAALKTASAFQKDPSSVSFADARAAASTANNFRQRHGEQVAAGVRTANSLNQKYGVVDKVSGLADGAAGARGQTTPSPVPGLAGKKKPPPPPPKKKPGLGGVPLPVAGGAAADDAPPPIPMSTRPQF